MEISRLEGIHSPAIYMMVKVTHLLLGKIDHQDCVISFNKENVSLLPRKTNFSAE